MAKLKMRNVFGLVLVCALFVGLLIGFSGLGLMEKSSSFNPFEYTYKFGNEINVYIGDKVYYENGYLKVNALYCGFGNENSYAIIQTDEVSNPQKIIIGNSVKISGMEFVLLETSCENEDKLVMFIKKE